jgi:hypothetical protein
MPDKPNYEIGYGKPPRHSRWKKGQSGNPTGKQRGVKSFATLLREAVHEKVTIVAENGRHRQITKLEAALTQLVNRAAQGDLKSTQTLLGLVDEIERGSGGASESGCFSKEDEEALRLIRDQLSRVGGGGNNDDA